uniref:Pectinesterase n=1 Tax=Physcomitrium patens TaxID=3218 RepID=A0A7I4DIC3_PHYPA
MMQPTSRPPLRLVVWAMLMPLIWLQAVVGQRDPFRLITDPDRTLNWRAVEADFLTWVDRVEHDYVESVRAGEAVLGCADHSILAGGNTLVVGGGGYQKVQDAIDAAPQGTRTVIQINPGTYREKILVPKSKILTFQGIENPILSWGDTANSAGSTQSSASTTIMADDFIANGIIFQNTAPAPPGGAIGRQAVAMRIAGDKGAFYDCKFYGAQDTLYDQEGRHYFKNCYIEGSIDFIFGDGKSIYQNCHLNSIAHPGSGSLTAQKRSGDEDTGFSFVGCSITGTGPIYLGRAWGPSSRVVFIQCYISDIILPEGWYDWGDSSRQKLDPTHPAIPLTFSLMLILRVVLDFSDAST